MKSKELPPYAPSLTETMRDIGYSLETAVADIIDNSLAAKAERVDIVFNFEGGAPSLAIIDNGEGMGGDELALAMQHGCINPRDKREKHDLGRFGLGMKTASFSQCRKLTVISRKNGEISGVIWDLDHIAKTESWTLLEMEDADISASPYVDHLHDTGGTMVVWEVLDRLLEGDPNTPIKDICYEKIENVEQHLALVFHRYISGEYNNKKLGIFINGMKVTAFDPFCLKNRATQILPEEIVRIHGQEIKITPYILPHHSKLSPAEHRFYKTRSDFVSNQGVYVYRNGRLMSWGNWFRIIPKSEATKLARIKVDFSNSLDEAWTIDIKKARAHPPFQVKQAIKRIVPRVSETSARVFKGRGKKLYDGNTKPLWERTAEHDGIKYSIDREHPLFKEYRNGLEENNDNTFKEILTHIEGSLPIEMIYSDYSSSPKEIEKSLLSGEEDLLYRLKSMLKIMDGPDGIDREVFESFVFSQKRFCENEDIVLKFISENFDAEDRE
ncbi:MAG: ATP-binding protein [Alphaproteobacteria bacterium]